MGVNSFRGTNWEVDFTSKGSKFESNGLLPWKLVEASNERSRWEFRL